MSPSVIHSVIDIIAKAQSVEKVRSILLALLEPTRRDDGCLKYKLFENINDHCQFTFIGAWEHEDSFDDYLQSNHFHTAETELKNDLTKDINVKRYKYIQNDPSQPSHSKMSSLCLLL